MSRLPTVFVNYTFMSSDRLIRKSNLHYLQSAASESAPDVTLCGNQKKSLITVEKQTEDVKDGYVVKDNIEYAFDNQIPLWMFGFLY